jgi:integrase
LKLPVRRKPYFCLLSPGVFVGYRRNVGSGSWSVKASDGHGSAWLKSFALADDSEESNGASVLDFWAASTKARELARVDDGQISDKPVTIDEALTAYEADLKARGADAANASRVRFNLPAGLLAKPVTLLSAAELRGWRNKMVKDGAAPASADRTARVLVAALTLSGSPNTAAWKTGLKRLPDTEQARSGVILPDETVKAIVSTAWDLDKAYGLLIELSAITGARRSQLLRTTVGDLQDVGASPRVMIPTSRKGRRRKTGLLALPIPPTLAKKLRVAAAGRPDDAPLLVRSDGSSWPIADELFRKVTAAAGLGPDLTAYSLRHSSIVRQILAGIPLRITAASHDTSAAMIEKNYSRYIIGDPSDAMCRKAMLDLGTAPASNIVAIR